ncbi:MAG TPA: hypothetical protein VK711_03765 [Puia sp.]|jgi:hypothetical protein|nr:hypothetical protein [Puia sp.]
MKTSTLRGKYFLCISRIFKNRTGLFIFIFLCFQFGEAKCQSCSLCCIPSFPSLTVYQAFQTGHGMGFGVEAGTWNKDAGKFSYFIGTSMVWTGINNPETKTATSSNQTLLSFYVKGQYKLTNHLYIVAAPGIVNLSYLELQTGLRYVFPVTSKIGIGIEPSYAINQKQLVVNANLHFALR